MCDKRFDALVLQVSGRRAAAAAASVAAGVVVAAVADLRVVIMGRRDR